MAAGFSTLSILDSNAVTRNMRVWDEGGPGPYTFTCDYPGSDGSGTIALGGTAQNLFGGTIPQHGFLVVNVDAAQMLWISLSTTAAPNTAQSIPLAAMGGAFVTPPGMVPFHAISIWGANTSQQFTAIKW